MAANAMEKRATLAARMGYGHRAARTLAALAAATVVTAHGGLAQAGDPFEIQVYDGTANPPLVPGIELHLNQWAGGYREAVPPEAPLHGQFHATLEPSLGLLPFWELGAYLQGAVRTDDGAVDWAGAKFRSKFVTPPSFSSNVRLGVNFEVSYLPATYDRDRWGSEIRPIFAWHDETWLLVVNPILDQALAGSGVSDGPSFQPALKAARTVGPVALGIEYYATLGPLAHPWSWSQQEQLIFEVLDLLSVTGFELNAGIGQGLTQASQGLVFKVILGYEFELGYEVERQEAPGTRLPLAASNFLGRP